MVSKRIVAAAYVAIALMLVVFWLGIHTLVRRLLLLVFVVGFRVAALVVADSWVKVFRRQPKFEDEVER